jgi:tetratricopeptide (TPR) repeat protein
MADLKKKADAAAKKNDRDSLVYRRTRQQVVAEAFEDGQAAFDLKKYDQALQDFEIAAAGARHPEYSQFQRARAYALRGDGKDLIATLKLAVGLGFDDASALDGDEFKAYRGLPEFQELVAQLKNKPH